MKLDRLRIQMSGCLSIRGAGTLNGVIGWTTFYHGGIKNGDSQSNTSESVTGSIQYDAFGNVTSSSGTWSGPFAYGGPYGYQSDPDSGLKLLGHRYYDSSTGRFLTRDPIQDGRNWYSYCDNNPLSFADINGAEKLVIVKRKGGFGLGSHALIGIEDNYGFRTYYGFYPSEESAYGSGGSGSSSSKGRTGPGYLRIFDESGNGSTISPEININHEQYVKIKRAITTEAMAYVRGNGRRYDLDRFNCATWIAHILHEAVEGDGFWDDPIPDVNQSRMITPKQMVEFLEGSTNENDRE